MEIVVTERTYNGLPAKVQSADGRYTYFHGADDYVMDTVADRAIFYARYLRNDEPGGDPLPESVFADVRAFRAAIAADKAVSTEAIERRERERHKADEANRYRYRPDVSDPAERLRLEREHDARYNEGGEGYNPWRDLY